MRARNGEAGFNDGLVLLTRQHEMFWAEAVYELGWFGGADHT